MLKRLELALRRGVLTLLRHFLRKRRSLPANHDFNADAILLLRQDLIGDALISTPFLHALATAYPAAKIDILLSPLNDFVFENEPAVRRRWVYDKRPLSTLGLVRRLRAERYDVVVDLIDNSSTTSTVMTLLAGARWKIGLQKENDFAYDIVCPQGSKQETHVADRTAELLRPFRINPSEANLHIHYSPSADADDFAKEFFARISSDAGPHIGINLSAGEEIRSWWKESCRETIRLIRSVYPGTAFLLLHKPADESKARAIHQEFPSAVVAHTPSFDHVAAVVRRLDGLLTPDTSIVQLAAAFQIPAVVLHIVTAAHHGHLWSPYRSPSENLVAPTDDIHTIPARDIFDAFHRLDVATGFSRGKHSR